MMEMKHPAEIRLEEYKRKRSEAEQTLQDLQKQREEAVRKGDPAKALELNKAIREAKNSLEDAETVVAAAEAHLMLINRNAPKAEAVKKQVNSTWLSLMKAVDDLREAQATVKECVSRIPRLKEDLDRGVTEYQHLTEEALVPTPTLDPIISNLAIVHFTDTNIPQLPSWEILTEREWLKRHEHELTARRRAEEAKQQEDLAYMRSHPPHCGKCGGPMTLTDTPPATYGSTELRYTYVCPKCSIRYMTTLEERRAGLEPVREVRPFTL